MKLTGIPDSRIHTPHGLVEIGRHGSVFVDGDKAQFLVERIQAGALPGYEWVEDAPADNNTEIGVQEPGSGAAEAIAGKAARKK